MFIAIGIAAIVIGVQLHARHRRADGAGLLPAHPRHPDDRSRRRPRAPLAAAPGRAVAGLEMAAGHRRAGQRRPLRPDRQLAGLVLSTILLIVMSSAASHEFRPKEAVISGYCWRSLAVGVFVIGLKLQIGIWPGAR